MARPANGSARRPEERATPGGDRRGDRTAGGSRCVIGCTTFRVADTIDLAEHAARAGADGVLCTPPPYAVLTPDEVVAFYQLVARGIRLPLMVYNWPPGTNVDIDTQTAMRLASIDRIVAIKDSTPHQEQLFRTLEATVDQVRFLGNFISQLGIFAVRDLGGDGFIGAGALLGPLQPRFFESIWAGDFSHSAGDRAQEHPSCRPTSPIRTGAASTARPRAN